MPARGKPYWPWPCAQGPRPVSCEMRLSYWLVVVVFYFLTNQFFNMNNIINRVQDTTPKFFKILRNIGVAMAAVSAAVFASNVALPQIVTNIAGYLVSAEPRRVA
jgi:hypothetical protein